MYMCRHTHRERKRGRKKWGITIWLVVWQCSLTFFFPVPRSPLSPRPPSFLFQAWESDTTLRKINHPLPLLVPCPRPQSFTACLCLLAAHILMYVLYRRNTFYDDSTGDLACSKILENRVKTSPRTEEKPAAFFLVFHEFWVVNDSHGLHEHITSIVIFRKGRVCLTTSTQLVNLSLTVKPNSNTCPT